MLYTEILKLPEIAEALSKAGVSDIPSTLLKDGDFITPFDEKSLGNYRDKIIDMEILGRRNFVEYQNKMTEHEKRMEPYKKLEEKQAYIKPYVERVIRGNIATVYESLEEGTIDAVAKLASEKYDFEIDGEVKSEPDYSGLTELERILKQSSITHLSSEMSIEEIVLTTIHNSPYAKFLK